LHLYWFLPKHKEQIAGYAIIIDAALHSFANTGVQSPVHRPAAPIACDAFNAWTVAGQKYHYSAYRNHRNPFHHRT